MKKQMKKLVLAKETVRELGQRLQRVEGGKPPISDNFSCLEMCSQDCN